MTYNQRIFRLLLSGFFALLASPSPVLASPCVLSPAATWYNTIYAGPYKLQFDDHDPSGPHPYRWVADAGMRIVHPDGTICLASNDVSIVALPIYIAAGHYLYIYTYSGSEAVLFVVDARSCATIWQSPTLYGMGFGRTKTGFYLPSVGWMTIGKNCLPEKITGKPVLPLQAPPPQHPLTPSYTDSPPSSPPSPLPSPAALAPKTPPPHPATPHVLYNVPNKSAGADTRAGF